MDNNRACWYPSRIVLDLGISPTHAKQRSSQPFSPANRGLGIVHQNYSNQNGNNFSKLTRA